MKRSHIVEMRIVFKYYALQVKSARKTELQRYWRNSVLGVRQNVYTYEYRRLPFPASLLSASIACRRAFCAAFRCYLLQAPCSSTRFSSCLAQICEVQLFLYFAGQLIEDDWNRGIPPTA